VATRAGGIVVGAGSIIDRSGGDQGLSVPYSSLAQAVFPTYQPDACPLCAAGSTAIKPGSRASI
jgi:orotate phosphoribosyltransferase